ncbi:collagen-like protein [Solirubrobacter soli]|uniref:collagen-like protein n=1 Tax=Solirubrobacter soli TaxID=363832 RepID=UPI00042A6F1E|nr:collagen-like protein [Solirubrobacter soli]
MLPMTSSRVALGVSLAALALSTTGTGYAVTKLSAKSVGARELKAGAVQSPAVKDGSLKLADLDKQARSQLVGPAGAPGEQGPAGPQGPQGSAGADGEPGASGVVATRHIDAANVSTSFALGPQLLLNCKTPAYSAGPGERAIVTAPTSIWPLGAPAGGVMGASVAVSIDGSPGAVAIGTQQFDDMDGGPASTAPTVELALVAGKSYRFAPLLQSTVVTNVYKSACQVSVLIVRGA